MITKTYTRGDDGKIRAWAIDTKEGVIYYRGYAGDFKGERIAFVGKPVASAQDLVNECE